MPEFCHLHCHTQFSLLDGAADINGYMEKAKADNMKALAITDHGNMFGAFKFYDLAKKHDIKPIIGCEFYVVVDRHKKEFSRENKDRRFHQLMLAKNAEGYKNLSKLCSLGFLEGYYSKYPRIDMELIKKYKDGLIATTCCVAAEVPRTFLEKGPEEAESVFLEWLDIFGEDYYIEIQRHGLTKIGQEDVNRFLLEMSVKHNVKVIATNDSHYVDQEDWNAHDVLLCINTGDFKSRPKGDGKGFRFGFENDQFYFKTGQEMADLFKEEPFAIENTLEIMDKIEAPQLTRDILLPNYTVPEGFDSQFNYLKHITFERAAQRYGELTQDIGERLDYELKVIKDMGYEGYFLIVQDFIEAAKERNVRVGPGRGSAAGSAIAYSIGITNIDPVKYNLLFERFLNPERVSMPDIDIDFDDEGRQKVIDYVVEKYGREQVAQIITYGTMAAKSSVRDVGRVMEYPLSETDKLAKMIPEGPGINLKYAFKEVKELGEIRKKEDTLPGQVLKMAEKLEGSVRHRGIHAAGIIIAPDDLTNYIPVCNATDSELYVTQFDGKYIEQAGMLKMDFLGLKTLSIIRDAIILIGDNHNIEINIDEIPYDDLVTLKLYQQGDTIGTFQFESDGMRKYLKELKPTGLEDLIAMNALYRPGPMAYIPEFIKRKHGINKVDYPHESLKGILETTYGIMVYQEQIMQTAQIIGGFSLGKADILRRAMGKKKMSVMQEMKSEFVDGAKSNNIENEKAEEIFGIMEKFAMYGFNRSHSAAYTVLAFQTGFLKANYPAEYMASVLTHNISDIKKLTYFLSECNRMGITTLGPDINESLENFAVNDKGEIRFALAGIKGVGGAAVEGIVEERLANGSFHNIYDFTKRVNLRSVNKKSVECLVKAGAFDSFDAYRSQYFQQEGEYTALETAIRFGNQYQQQKISAQNSLFGEDVLVATVSDPKLPVATKWTIVDLLKNELEVTGMYISGHPLDEYKLELRHFCVPVSEIENLKNKEIKIGGIVKNYNKRVDKRGRQFGLFEIEDYSGSTRMALFSDNFIKFANYVENDGIALLISGKYKLRYRSEDEYEFQPTLIELMETTREKYGKELELSFGLSDLSNEMIADLETLLGKHKGKVPVNICIVDQLEELEVTFMSRKFLVELNNEFISSLNKMSTINYALNT